MRNGGASSLRRRRSLWDGCLGVDGDRLEREIERVIRDHGGPLYSLAFPVGAGAEALALHAMRPATKAGTQPDCSSFKTNMSTSPLQLCRLERIGGAADAKSR